MAYVGPMLGLLCLAKSPHLGLSTGAQILPYVRTYVGPMLAYVGPMLGLCWAYVGPCGAMVRQELISSQNGNDKSEHYFFCFVPVDSLH